MEISQLHLETEFEWDDTKRKLTLKIREMDLADGARALLEPHISWPSVRNDENRTLAICRVNERIVAVVYAMRGDRCRIVTMRPARRNEREKYRQIFGR